VPCPCGRRRTRPRGRRGPASAASEPRGPGRRATRPSCARRRTGSSGAVASGRHRRRTSERSLPGGGLDGPHDRRPQLVERGLGRRVELAVDAHEVEDGEETRHDGETASAREREPRPRAPRSPSPRALSASARRSRLARAARPPPGSRARAPRAPEGAAAVARAAERRRRPGASASRGAAPPARDRTPKPASRAIASVVSRKNLTGPRRFPISGARTGPSGPCAPRLTSTPRAASPHRRSRPRHPAHAARRSATGPR